MFWEINMIYAKIDRLPPPLKAEWQKRGDMGYGKMQRFWGTRDWGFGWQPHPKAILMQRLSDRFRQQDNWPPPPRSLNDIQERVTVFWNHLAAVLLTMYFFLGQMKGIGVKKGEIKCFVDRTTFTLFCGMSHFLTSQRVWWLRLLDDRECAKRLELRLTDPPPL